MEHILQFGISIDDEAIRNRIQERAYDDIVEKLMDEAKKDLRLTGRFCGRDSWADIVHRAMTGYLDDNKDIIIERAAEKLVESYKRTKAFRERMEDAMEEGKADDNT